jgi:hypothetical protein
VRQHPLEASEDIRVLSLLSALKLVKASSNWSRPRTVGVRADWISVPVEPVATCSYALTSCGY